MTNDTQTATLTEFLLARLAEDEALALAAQGDGEPQWFAVPDPARVLAEVAAKRAIVEFHESWPVLVQKPPTFDRADVEADINSMTYRMSQQISWLTTQEYRTRFGDEPPTAPMLAALAEVYADHPDYDEAWRP